MNAWRHLLAEAWSPRYRVLTFVALIVIGAAALVPTRSLWLLYTGHGVDMQTRWQEVQYVLRGIDPNVNAGVRGEPHEPIVLDEFVLPERVHPIGVYPPWSYTLSVPLLWPAELGSATLWFAIINALLLGVLSLWLLLRGADTGGVLFGAASVLALLALASLHQTLVVGNYGVVVLAALAGSMVALERGRPGLSGVLFGLALIKPTLSGPFFIALVAIALRTGWSAALRLALTASAVVIGASLVFWWATGSDPLSSLLAGQQHLSYFVNDGGGAPDLWDALPVPSLNVGGFEVMTSQYFGMVVGLAGGIVAAFVARRASALTQFGIASVVALTWTYHRPYDALLLLFLLLALAVIGVRADRPARRAVALGTATVLAAALFLPLRYLGWPDSTPLVHTIWLGTAGVLLALASGSDHASAHAN